MIFYIHLLTRQLYSLLYTCLEQIAELKWDKVQSSYEDGLWRVSHATAASPGHGKPQAIFNKKHSDLTCWSTLTSNFFSFSLLDLCM